MINLKGLRAQAKAMGIKYYYRMTKSGLECAIMRHFSSGAVFVPNENNDNSDANFLGTFSFSYFNDKGERTSTNFNLSKKYTRSVVIPEKIITENHYAYFGESFIEFCEALNSPVAIYYPYLDTIQFREAWTMHYRQLGSAVNEFSFEYSLRSVLNDILKSAGYLDDNGNFIHDAYGAFRIHAWNFFMQDRQHNELKDFIMPDVVFSGYEDRDNPITWVNDSPEKNNALRAYIRLLYTEDNAKIIKKYCPHDEGILDSFILNLRDSIQRMHHSYSDLNEDDAMSYDEAVNALCDTALKYDVHSDALLNSIFLRHHSALDDDFAQILEKCSNRTLREIAFNNTAPLYVCSGSGRGNNVSTRKTEILSLAENLGTIAAGILAERISKDSIMKHHDNHKRVALWIMFLERRKEGLK